MAETTQGPQEPPRSPKLKAILARKLGMTQIFNDQGIICPATELEAGPCAVVTVKTKERDGYTALTLGFGKVPEANVNKPELGTFKKAGIEPSVFLKEVRVAHTDGWVSGQQVLVSGMFQPGDYVDVAGVSKGKGFAGGVKRWGFRGGPATHGQSDRHRAPGSLAGRRSLGRVLPGKRMAGHLGDDNVVVYKMRILKVEPETNRLYVMGGVPGAKGSFCVVRETVKSRKHQIQAVP
ncbi:MAG: 50S ribosomal protein L3, partial [Elusimicrobia bacterium]|nr:50S ribosomal protein L3 [Elusimicrobiota bacterium]